LHTSAGAHAQLAATIAGNESVPYASRDFEPIYLPSLLDKPSMLTAAGNRSKAVGAYRLPDRFLEEMMAQARGFQSSAPKPDPRFTRP
jgi:hypothetical protein